MVPQQLDIEILPGGFWNRFWGVWDTESTVVLANGESHDVPFKSGRTYLIWTLGTVGSLSVLGTGLCAGALGVYAEGHLDDQGTSTLDADYAGMLHCGVLAGNSWLSITVSVGFAADTIQV